MILEPAGIDHVWLHALAKGWSPSPHEYGLLIAETVAGRVWAGVDADGTPQAIGGMFDGRCWLSLVPGAGRQIVGLVRVLKTMRNDQLSAFDPPAICVVRDDNPAGQRLARLLGFEPTRQATGQLRDWRLA